MDEVTSATIYPDNRGDNWAAGGVVENGVNEPTVKSAIATEKAGDNIQGSNVAKQPEKTVNNDAVTGATSYGNIEPDTIEDNNPLVSKTTNNSTDSKKDIIDSDVKIIPDTVTSATDYGYKNDDSFTDNHSQETKAESKPEEIKVVPVPAEREKTEVAEVPAVEEKSEPVAEIKPVEIVESEETESKPVITQADEGMEAVVLTSDNKTDVNKDIQNDEKNISGLIIFNKNEKDKIPPSMRFELEDGVIVEKTDYELPGYRPSNLVDFLQSRPLYVYDSSGLITGGQVVVGENPGYEVFMLAYKYLKEGKNNQAINLFSKLIHYNYSTIQSEYFLAMGLYKSGDTVTALRYLERLGGREKVMSVKEKCRFFDFKGLLYYKIGSYLKSATAYSKVAELDPTNASIYNKIGISYYKSGEFDRAYLSWQKGDSMGDKDSADNYKWLAAQKKN